MSLFVPPPLRECSRFAQLAGSGWQQGLIRRIGVSNVTAAPDRAQQITDIVCVQNHYNLVHRHDDALIDELARQGIAFIPFFPLGDCRPLQS